MECDNCKWKESCIAEYGDLRDDGDDYRAIEGSHLCRKSWDPFYKSLKKKEAPHGKTHE